MRVILSYRTIWVVRKIIRKKRLENFRSKFMLFILTHNVCFVRPLSFCVENQIVDWVKRWQCSVFNTDSLLNFFTIHIVLAIELALLKIILTDIELWRFFARDFIHDSLISFSLSKSNLFRTALESSQEYTHNIFLINLTIPFIE